MKQVLKKYKVPEFNEKVAEEMRKTFRSNKELFKIIDPSDY